MINMDYALKMKRCQYVAALEEERRKIQVFQRELPLCLELVTQVIEGCRREISGSTIAEYVQGAQTECSEQTSSDGPVLEEFIPIKRSSSSDKDEQELHKSKNNSNNNNKEKNGDKKKSDWLRSVQLWNNQSPDPPCQEDAAKNGAAVEVRRNGGAFQPFHREKNDEKSVLAVAKPTASIPASTTSSSTENGGKGSDENVKKEEKETQEAQRKQRRCWSPELHRRFVHALQQLGGSHVATPKQIREIMKVDGLTNDEVKSHLQKYRLHTRRPTPSAHGNVNAQPQFVVVGGIWMHSPEYAPMATTTTTTTLGETASVTPTSGIYTPIPTVPQPSGKMLKGPKPIQFEEMGSHSERGVHSNSPAASSSSTHTTTTSPMS